MMILRRKAQNEMLIHLGVIQHRAMEALPALIEVETRANAETFFRSVTETIQLLAAAIDPVHGQRFLLDAYEASRDAIVRPESKKETEKEAERT